jgi:hypothetical protein
MLGDPQALEAKEESHGTSMLYCSSQHPRRQHQRQNIAKPPQKRYIRRLHKDPNTRSCPSQSSGCSVLSGGPALV